VPELWVVDLFAETNRGSASFAPPNARSISLAHRVIDPTPRCALVLLKRLAPFLQLTAHSRNAEARQSIYTDTKSLSRPTSTSTFRVFLKWYLEVIKSSFSCPRFFFFHDAPKQTLIPWHIFEAKWNILSLRPVIWKKFYVSNPSILRCYHFLSVTE
jgi:hypothetical protein